MGAISAFALVVRATIPRESWDETYFSLLSLKARMQAVPGFQRLDIWARDEVEGSVNLVTVTNWDEADQLVLWRGSTLSVEALLKQIDPPPVTLTVEFYEQVT